MELENVSCVLCGSEEAVILQKPQPVGLVKCRQCGLAFLNPRPSRSEHHRFHQPQYFHNYYNQTIEEFYSRKGPLYGRTKRLNELRLDVVRQYVQCGKLLDIGAGQGMFITLARQSGFSVAATDVMDYEASYFRGKGYDYRTGYLDDIELPNAEFDAVTMWHTLEHTLNPHMTLMNAHRLLKAGGYVFVAVPNFDSLASRLKLIIGSNFFGADSAEVHYFQFTPATLQRLLAKCGFEVVGCRADIKDKLKPSWRGYILETVSAVMGCYPNILCIARKV
ncbi:MAG: class I SAM-dependent methyltransferase [Planctomycetota bacterium]